VLQSADLAHGVTLIRCLRSASNSAIIATERNAALKAQDVLEVLLGLVQVHALNGKGGLSGVLEVDAQI